MTVSLGVLVDAPAPRPPLYTLIGAANVITETDEHYLLGVEVRGLPISVPSVWAWQTHLDWLGGGTKALAGASVNPSFGGFTVYLREQCNSRGLGAQAYADRVNRLFPVVEAFAVEREFMRGLSNPASPHLTGEVPVPGGADSTVYPVGDTVQPLIEGVALLEACIAQTGRAGIIHMTPSALTRLAHAGTGVASQNRGGSAILQTIIGTIVVPGYGYEDAASNIFGNGVGPAPAHAAPTGTQEWIYATGMVDIRRQQDVTLTPEATEEQLGYAIDRSENLLTYEASRAYVFDWDANFKAAVRVDRAT